MSSEGGWPLSCLSKMSSLCRRAQNLPTLVLCVDKRFSGKDRLGHLGPLGSRKLSFHSPRAWRELPGRWQEPKKNGWVGP